VNLLDIGWFQRALHSRFYPAIFQWITTAAFAVILLSVLFGPNNAGQNFGMAFTWTLWWPLLAVSFVLLGRFWCAICPFAWLTDTVRNTVGVQLSVPLFLRRRGPWVIAALFLLVSYLAETCDLESDARKTGYLMLALFTAVVFFGAFFERRTFCRHICFMGAFAANYSRTGILELRADTGRCRDCSSHACYYGTAEAAGCPMFLPVPNMEDSGTCELCANCIKNCPRGAIRISLRKPLEELCGIRQPQFCDAMLACLIAGVALLEQFPTPGGWDWPMFALFLAAPVATLWLMAAASEALIGRVSPGNVKRNFSLAGYAVIPLALASHLAHVLDRLMTWSRTAPFALAAMFGWFPANPGGAWAPRNIVLWTEIIVLSLGLAASLLVSFRMAGRRILRARRLGYWPHGLWLLGLFGANLYAVAAMMRRL